MRRLTIDSERFDEISRMMAGGASRRTVLRGVFGGALAALGVAGAARDSAAKAEKFDICHYDADTGAYHRINVSRNALQAHLNHGDLTASSCPDNHALDFDSCECVCELTRCADGYDLDETACQCVPVAPTDVCAQETSEIGTKCDQYNLQRECSWSLDDGKLVCVNVFAGSGSEPPFEPCESSADCPEAGELCVNDWFGDGHCHPIDVGL